MAKKFTANCDFSGQQAPVTFYIGEPAANSPHPLNFQNKWLIEKKGGIIPSDIMDSFAKLMEISIKNRVPFEDLCAYVVDEVKSSHSLKKDSESATALSKKDKK